MTAVNKYPWVKNLSGAGKPLLFPGKVQAGSSATIKRGEICTYDETSGYFVAADAVADRYYSLAIAAEEQKSDDLERYMEFFALRSDDVFEFALDASAQVSLGDGLELTASDSQTLTRDVDGDAVAVTVNIDNYPESGTTMLYRSYVQCCFLPVYSYWVQRVMKPLIRKIITVTTTYTLKVEDCGCIISTKGDADGVAITAPEATVPIGWWFDLFCGADTAVTFDPKPDTAKIYIAGGAQTAGKYASITDIGDFTRYVWDGTDWLALFSISGADGDITIQG